MGYDLHITRRAQWWDEAGEVITHPEWQALVAADHDLTPLPLSPAVHPGPHSWTEVLTMVPGPRRPDPFEALLWFNGEIRVKNPTNEMIVKMGDLAARLGATVQGDDCEVYRVARLPDGRRLVTCDHGLGRLSHVTVLPEEA